MPNPERPPARSQVIRNYRRQVLLFAVRDEIGLRRDHLKRHAGHEEKVVAVKTAHSA